jgi:hypothetical protein
MRLVEIGTGLAERSPAAQREADIAKGRGVKDFAPGSC